MARPVSSPCSGICGARLAVRCSHSSAPPPPLRSSIPSARSTGRATPGGEDRRGGTAETSTGAARGAAPEVSVDEDHHDDADRQDEDLDDEEDERLRKEARLAFVDAVAFDERRGDAVASLNGSALLAVAGQQKARESDRESAR